MGGRERGGVRVDVNEELKFLGKFKKKMGGGRVAFGGVGLRGQGGCERRIEEFEMFSGGSGGGRVGGGLGWM